MEEALPLRVVEALSVISGELQSYNAEKTRWAGEKAALEAKNAELEEQVARLEEVAILHVRRIKMLELCVKEAYRNFGNPPATMNFSITVNRPKSSRLRNEDVPAPTTTFSSRKTAGSASRTSGKIEGSERTFTQTSMDVCDGEEEDATPSTRVNEGRENVPKSDLFETVVVKPGSPSTNIDKLQNHNGGTLITKFFGEKDPPPPWKKFDPKLILRAHLSSVTACKFHPSAAFLVSASEDRTVSAWSLAATGPYRRVPKDPLRCMYGHTCPVVSMDIAEDGSLVASSDTEGTVCIWRIPSSGRGTPSPRTFQERTEDEFASFVAHASAIGETKEASCVGIVVRGGTTCVAVSQADMVELWHADEGKASFSCQLGSQPAGEDAIRSPVTAVKMGRSGTHARDSVLVGHADGRLNIFDANKERCVTKLGASVSGVNEVAFHGDIPIVISACNDGRAYIYDSRASNSAISSVVVHNTAATGVEFDPTGFWFGTSCRDGHVRIWDLRSSRCCQDIDTGHAKFCGNMIFDFAFHRRLGLLATAGADGIVQVYQ